MITALPFLTMIVTEGCIPPATAGALESEWREIPGCKQEEQQQQPATRAATASTRFVDPHRGAPRLPRDGSSETRSAERAHFQRTARADLQHESPV